MAQAIGLEDVNNHVGRLYTYIVKAVLDRQYADLRSWIYAYLGYALKESDLYVSCPVYAPFTNYVGFSEVTLEHRPYKPKKPKRGENYEKAASSSVLPWRSGFSLYDIPMNSIGLAMHLEVSEEKYLRITEEVRLSIDRMAQTRLLPQFLL